MCVKEGLLDLPKGGGGDGSGSDGDGCDGSNAAMI
jgi:hypothetical protein